MRSILSKQNTTDYPSSNRSSKQEYPLICRLTGQSDMSACAVAPGSRKRQGGGSTRPTAQSLFNTIPHT